MTACHMTKPLSTSMMDLNYLKQEPGSVQSVKSEPALLVNEDILDDSNQDSNERQRVQDAATLAGTDSINEACCTGDLINVKQELDDMDIGPTVLQHTDLYYTINKNMIAVKEVNSIVDSGNEAMPCCEVKTESVENELRGIKIISCKYRSQITTEEDYNETQYCMGQQDDSQQHFLRQYPAMSSNGFKCEVCSRVIYKPSLLSSSKTSVTSTAAGPFNRKQPETIHDETTKTKLVECDISESCHFGLNFAQYSDLTKHIELDVNTGMKVRTGENPDQCDTCDVRFAQSGDLTMHMTVHRGEKPHHCDMCNAKFSHRSHLNQHMRVHTGEKPYQCGMCDAKFSQRGGLTQHMRVHTGEKPYQCDKCDAKFAQSGGLTQHMKVHTYQCDKCNAKFAYRSSLNQHMKVHTGEKPYHCDMCNAKFSHRSYLNQHMRVHTGEKPYQCDTCDSKFAQSSGLTQHMKVHTAEKPYRCDKCDAKFALQFVLTRHNRVHTGENPYKCDMCDAKFALRHVLTRHMRLHTGEKP